MRTPEGKRPAYNVQTAVDAEHALIVAQQVTSKGNDQRSLLPMALAAKQALGSPEALNIVADARGTPTGNKQRPAKRKACCRMCRGPAASTIKGMASSSKLPTSTMTRTPTPSAVRLGRRSAASNPKKIGGEWCTRRRSKSAAPVP